MNRISILALLAGTVFAFPAFAADPALQESNTVASTNLLADFAVVKTAGEPDALATVDLFKKAASENEGPVLLALSDNESVTFYLGDASVACKRGAECRVPYQKEASYRVELKRFNGELVKATVALPAETAILSPSENTVLKATDPLRVTWQLSKSSGPYGLTVSILPEDPEHSCDTTGFTNWDQANSAVVPANYVAGCLLPLHGRFSVFYQNISSVPGVAGGAFKGYSQAQLHFLYLQDGIHLETASENAGKRDIPLLLRNQNPNDEKARTILR